MTLFGTRPNFATPVARRGTASGRLPLPLSVCGKGREENTVIPGQVRFPPPRPAAGRNLKMDEATALLVEALLVASCLMSVGSSAGTIRLVADY